MLSNNNEVDTYGILKNINTKIKKIRNMQNNFYISMFM